MSRDAVRGSQQPSAPTRPPAKKPVPAGDRHAPAFTPEAALPIKQNAAALTTDTLLTLQRRAGNAAVCGLVGAASGLDGQRGIQREAEDAGRTMDDGHRPASLPISPRGGTAQLLQRAQDPHARRASRIDVATSVQAHRPTYPGSGGGLLTQALLARLRNKRETVSGATAAVGAGTRTFGSAPVSGEERAGVSLGRPAGAAPGTRAQRIAVVIGNAVYRPGTTMGNTVEPTRPLPSSVTDARRITAALGGRGYTVRAVNNQTASQINDALTSALAGLPAGSEFFFFFSGHGTPEGLIGVDGVAFTPAQMLAIRAAARTAQVNLVINTDACHAGIFADAIRGSELRDTRTAAAGGMPLNAPLVALLDAAIAVQNAKDAYNTTIQAWWARRYRLEAAISAPPPLAAADPRQTAWQAHYEAGGRLWNNFVVRANPILAAMGQAATAAGVSLRALTLTPAPTPFTGDGEALVQAGLDDVDTLTNEVLTRVDQWLP